MGPQVSILLADAPTDANRSSLLTLLERLGPPTGAAGTDFTTVVETTKPIGGTYEGEGRLLDGAWWEGEAYPGENEHWPTRRVDLAHELGVDPAAGLTLSMGCNDPTDHRILGELALHLATSFGGVIDFHGELLPSFEEVSPEWPWRGGHVDLSQVSRPAPEPTARLLSSLPGKVVAHQYQTSAGRTATCHVADSEFMAGWLMHPNFHMIK